MGVISESAAQEALEGLEARWSMMRDEGAEYHFEIPDKTVKDYFDHWVREKPDAPFVIDFDGNTYTYGMVSRWANQVANALLTYGYMRGDRIIAYLNNRIELVIISAACFKIGAVIVSSNPRDTASEMAFKIADSGARYVFVEPLAAEALSSALADEDVSPDFIITCKGAALDNDYPASVITFEKFVEDASPDEPQIEVLPDDLQALQYTGGTTGVSKGCCVTNRNFIAKALSAVQFNDYAHAGDDRSFALALPLSHAYGFTEVFVGMIVSGAWTVFMQPRPTLEDMLSTIERFRPTCWPCVPAILNMLAARQDLLDRYDLSSLRSIISAAAPLPIATIEAVEKATGAKITEGYGLTEAGTGVTGMPYCIHEPGKTGIPLPNLDVLTVDLETGTRQTAIGEDGEVIVRGVQVCNGYWNKPEETANTFRDGWLYTGDVGRFDENGLLTITGRIKEMLIVSGFNVYPRQIDEVIMQHPNVAESCTIGVPDFKSGEVPVTYVVLVDGATVDSRDLRELAEEHLVRYKVPRHFIVVDEIPTTKAGKPDRTLLRMRYDEDVAMAMDEEGDSNIG